MLRWTPENNVPNLVFYQVRRIYCDSNLHLSTRLNSQKWKQSLILFGSFCWVLTIKLLLLLLLPIVFFGKGTVHWVSQCITVVVYIALPNRSPALCPSAEAQCLATVNGILFFYAFKKPLDVIRCNICRLLPSTNCVSWLITTQGLGKSAPPHPLPPCNSATVYMCMYVTLYDLIQILHSVTPTSIWDGG